MNFSSPLIAGHLIKRYKRFLADVVVESGELLTVHCPNSGSMKSCTGEGWPVMISRSPTPHRKLPYTLEMTHNGKTWIGINTQLPNKIVLEGIQTGAIPELAGYPAHRTEVPYGTNSRIDILLENAGQLCYVEVKNVTLVEADGINYFPDAVTSRGLKHLQELTAMIRQGHRAALVFLIQRSDGVSFRPAAHIDPKYALGLREAQKNGLLILPYHAEVMPHAITITGKLDYYLN